MSLPPDGLSRLTPGEVDTRGVDFAVALPPGDTLASCVVSIATGSCELAATLGGTYGATASATLSGTEAIVAIRAALDGPLALLFHATTAAGRVLDETVQLTVAPA